MRALLPPPVSDLLEPLRQPIVKQEPADQRLADSRHELQHFQRLQRADHAGERAQNPGLRAGRQKPFGRRRRERCRGRRGCRPRRVSAPSPSRRSGRPRRSPAAFSARRRYRRQVARGKIVGAVGDDIVAGDELSRVLRIQPHLMRHDVHMRVDRDKRLLRALHLRRADLFGRWMICRCRLERLTTSSSTMPSVPIPAAAR